MSETESMRRTPGVSYEPNDYADVVDFTADYALDAVDAGVPPKHVAKALREAAKEIDVVVKEREVREQE